jgi:DDE superfamily endonuclease
VAQIAARDAPGKPIEIWFEDEARIGQKNKITRRWARRGTRPSAPHDQRTRSTYIFGAICPARGTGAGLILPFCNTAAMALHLAEISRTVMPGAHAVLLLDQAGWHLSAKLDIPDNITLMPLPPKSPELNPVENIWQFIRDNWLSNRVFRSYDDILEHCCHAWNRLIDQPWTIMSIGLRDWAHRSCVRQVQQIAGLVMMGVGGAEPPHRAASATPGRRHAATALSASFLRSRKCSMLR